MRKVDRPVTQYRWEAYDPDTGNVFKRGMVRTELAKSVKNAMEIHEHIVEGTRLAPYWHGAEIRIIARSITPWEQVAEISEIIEESESKV